MIDGCFEKYVKLCLQLGDYGRDGVKKHNQAMKELAKIFHELKDDKKRAGNLYKQLMDHNDERVRIMAAAHSLGLNVNLVKAQKTLKKIKHDSADPETGFSAGMTLRIWQEQGYLNF